MFNDLLKNVMSLGIITEDDVKRLTSIELMLLIIERTNGLLTQLNSYIQSNDKRIEELNKKLEEVNQLIKESLYDLAVEQLNTWLTDGTLEQLINETALSHINEQLTQIKNDNNSIVYYPRLEGEVDDHSRFLRAIEGTPSGGVLHIPAGSYQLNDYLILTKGITLQGDGMNSTNIFGGGLKIKSSNVTINDLNVNCPQKANGFQCNEGSFSNIRINRCRSIARDHGFLFESYYGTVQNVIIQDCMSEGSVHGFISKAYDVKFINCKANNHQSGFGFGIISDNIPSIDNVANCFFNVIENCRAYNCSSGVRSYCRDKWSLNCTPFCYNNTVKDFIALDCHVPVSIGEENIPDGYLSIKRIEYTTLIGVQDFGTKQSVYSINLANTYRCMIDNCTLMYNLNQVSGKAIDNIIGNIVTKNTYFPNVTSLAINQEKTYEINVSLNTSIELFLQNGSTANSIIKFVGSPKNGNILTVVVRNAGKNTFGGFDTSNTIIDHSKTNVLTTGITFNCAQVTQWIWCRGLSKWLCIYASDLISLA